jgi:hypothetical protein
MYIHASECISAQSSFQKNLTDVLENCQVPVDDKMLAIEPNYSSFLPVNLIRRMGKASRISVTAAMSLLKNHSALSPDGIILGTGFGGLEDNLLFLKQIIEYEEGRLTPTHFVSSMPSALLAPIILMTSMRGYNVVHTQKGFAFEQAVLDAEMRLEEKPEENLLLGATDELTDSNYNPLNSMGLLLKKSVESLSIDNDYSKGTILGEAAIYFLVNGKKENAIAELNVLGTFYGKDKTIIQSKIQQLISEKTSAPDLILAGYNYDAENNSWVDSLLKPFPSSLPVTSFKNLCGEFPTAASFAVWMAIHIVAKKEFPKELLVKSNSPNIPCNRIWIINSYMEKYHTVLEVTNV